VYYCTLETYNVPEVFNTAYLVSFRPKELLSSKKRLSCYPAIIVFIRSSKSHFSFANTATSVLHHTYSSAHSLDSNFSRLRGVSAGVRAAGVARASRTPRIRIFLLRKYATFGGKCIYHLCIYFRKPMIASLAS
jgi:hypothetical protein